MKDKYKKIDNKMAFLKALGKKIGIEVQTLQIYLSVNGTIPEKHKEIFTKAIDLQLEADEKIRQIEVCVFEEL